MLARIAALTWKELYTTYTDRNSLLIMLATPLALATIIGLAFSGFAGGSGDVPVRDIPIAVVNLDRGTSTFGFRFNNGTTFVDLLVPPDGEEPDPDNVLHTLTDAVAMTDADAARAAVDRGDLRAAIIIPADFSQRLSISAGDLQPDPATVEVYASPATPVSTNIVRSIADGIANTLATGNITVSATVNFLIQRASEQPALTLALLGRFRPDFAPAFDPDAGPLRIEQQTVSGERATFDPLAYFGAAQAVFFVLFTAQGGANSLLEERRDGTLQRLLVTPTPRLALLLGKLTGTFVACVFQLVLLFIFLTLIGSLLGGEFAFIWGRHLGLIVLAILASALAASGLGTLITALVRTPEQGNIVGGAVIIAMGVFGGTFFAAGAIPALAPLTRLTINFWATEMFTLLALDQIDIGLHLAVLVALGAGMFLVGLALFNRRLEV